MLEGTGFLPPPRKHSYGPKLWCIAAELLALLHSVLTKRGDQLAFFFFENPYVDLENRVGQRILTCIYIKYD
jgi:hypothetical protein